MVHTIDGNAQIFAWVDVFRSAYAAHLLVNGLKRVGPILKKGQPAF